MNEMNATPDQERRRLRKLSSSLRAFHARQLALHDPEANFASILSRTLRTHLEPEYRKKAVAVRTTEERARAGCAICGKWLSDTSELRAEIQRLFDLPLQKPAGWRMPPSSSQFKRAGSRRKKKSISLAPMTIQQVAALHAEMDARRSAREEDLRTMLRSR